MILNTLTPPITVEACFPDNSIGSITFPNDLYDTKTRYVVIYFYPGDFTSICATEVLAFHAAMSRFGELGVKLVACSTNGAETHAAWKTTPKLNGGLGTAVNHTMLSDTCRALSTFFDVLIPGRNIATRGLFIIGKDGRILLESRQDTKTPRCVETVEQWIRNLVYMQ